MSFGGTPNIPQRIIKTHCSDSVIKQIDGPLVISLTASLPHWDLYRYHFRSFTARPLTTSKQTNKPKWLRSKMEAKKAHAFFYVRCINKNKNRFIMRVVIQIDSGILCFMVDIFFAFFRFVPAFVFAYNFLFCLFIHGFNFDEFSGDKFSRSFWMFGHLASTPSARICRLMFTFFVLFASNAPIFRL